MMTARGSRNRNVARPGLDLTRDGHRQRMLDAVFGAVRVSLPTSAAVLTGGTSVDIVLYILAGSGGGGACERQNWKAPRTAVMSEGDI